MELTAEQSQKISQMVESLSAESSHVIFARTFAEISYLHAKLNVHGFTHRTLRASTSGSERTSMLSDFEKLKFSVLIVIQPMMQAGWRLRMGDNPCSINFSYTPPIQDVNQGWGRLGKSASVY